MKAKTKSLFVLTLVLTMIISIFAMAPSAGAVSSKPVELIYAKPTKYEVYMGAQGYIDVENIAYEKNITIHYSYDGISWEDIAAEYYAPSSGNREIWKFQIPNTYSIGMRFNATITFAIKYEVNGETYWDNNNGSNYSVATGYGIPTRYDFGCGSAALHAVSRYPTNKDINGTIQLKNIAYEKDVRIRYTTDNWATYNEVSAQYLFSVDDRIEEWKFELPPTEDTVEFAISYTVNGTTYWDNNFGENYTV